MEKLRTELLLPEKLKKEAKERAAKEHRSLNSLIIVALEEYLDNFRESGFMTKEEAFKTQNMINVTKSQMFDELNKKGSE